MAKKRRSKKSTKKKDVAKKDQLTELCGLKLDQKIWGTTVGGLTVFGPISEFHDKNAEGPALTLYDEINGGFRVILVESSMTEPPKGGKRKLTASRMRESRVKR
ncbi:MAG: hypothetical protein QF442_03155 [Candidatus Peribacteraceae bacterium]|nr:hypothetical protein [Candidatus Peribacteraceae bacterium]